MTGRAEVARMKQKLDATFKRLDGAGLDTELQSDFARYLCILVSGYLEKAAYELVVEHARNGGRPSFERFVDQRTRKFTNANFTKLKVLLGDFDSEWAELLESRADESLKEAVNAVVALRNKIAHGESVGITYRTISDYYSRVQQVIEVIAILCAP